MKLLKLINLEGVSEGVAVKYRTREAARAVVIDEKGLVAMLHSTVNHYYKLPGGGIEEGEDHITAVKRECLEEIGCDIEVGKELGMIVEHRSQMELKQISYCYLAKLKGKKGIPHLEPGEIEEGFVTVWLPIDKAIKEIAIVGDPSVYEAPYMATRDLAFLEEAKKQLHAK